MKFIRDCLTSRDGESWEVASILGLIAFLVFIYFSWHAYIILGKDFDPQNWGLGAGGLAAGSGAHKLMSGKADYDK